LSEKSDEDVIEAFYRFISSPIQTNCKVGKWLSYNRFYPNCGSTDGEWFVCLDNIFKDVNRNKCLVYSFGLADDITFENELSDLGCTVHAYDPTVTPPEIKNPEIVHFHSIGLSHYHGQMTLTINQENNRKSDFHVTTLAKAMESNGHTNTSISYLKVDVESSEINSIPEWLQTGALNNVQQIGIEMHTGKVHLTSEERPNVFRQLLKSFQELYKIGFRLVSYAPNLCVGNTSQDQDSKNYYTYADIVFIRSN